MNFMGDFYEELKGGSGIDENFMKIDKTDVPKIEHVLKTMYPNCKARNFKELLKYEKEQEIKAKRARKRELRRLNRTNSASGSSSSDESEFDHSLAQFGKVK